MIDILVPVLDRPQNAQPLVDSIRANTVIEHRITFLVTPDDTAEIVAVTKTECPMIPSPDHRYAAKINLGVQMTDGEFIFLGADDLAFQPNWDLSAIKTFQDTRRPVVGTNDLGNPSVIAGTHATHSLVHRSYVERGTADEPGKLLHDGYEHNWVDTEFIDTAKKRSAFVFCADSHVEHLHPFWHKGPDDATYVKGRLSYRTDARLYQKRRRLWR